jgi:hypothetical protein
MWRMHVLDALMQSSMTVVGVLAASQPGAGWLTCVALQADHDCLIIKQFQLHLADLWHSKRSQYMLHRECESFALLSQQDGTRCSKAASNMCGETKRLTFNSTQEFSTRLSGASDSSVISKNFSK